MRANSGLHDSSLYFDEPLHKGFFYTEYGTPVAFGALVVSCIWLYPAEYSDIVTDFTIPVVFIGVNVVFILG
jgi:hypothetical protein